MTKKAQTAVEFLTTYGWVILGVIILLAILTYYGAFNPLRFVPRQCTFEPGLPCTTNKLEVNQTTIRLITQLSNDLGYDIALPENALLLNAENLGKSGKYTYIGNCSPRLPYVIKKGGTFTCIVEITDKELIPEVGKNIRLQTQLTYKNCLTDPNYLATGNCTSAANYTSTGTEVTPMESYSRTLYCGDGICSASIGENPSTCSLDCPPPASIILTANPATVAPDGNSYSTINATVRDKNGQPMNNTEVVFTSQIGKFSSYTAVTDTSGRARVNITSTQAGVATITGVVPPLSNTTTVKFYFMPSAIILQPNPQYLQVCLGPGQSALTATVLDQRSSPIPDMDVNLSYSAVGDSSLTPTYGITDSSGAIYASFTTDTGQNATITALTTDPSIGVSLSNSTNITAWGCMPCTPPPSGVWTIVGVVLCEDRNILMHYDINITPGSVLILKNSTLELDYGVTIHDKGELLLIDKDNNPSTMDDASVLDLPNSGETGFIWLNNTDNGLLFINNSKMTDCGGEYPPGSRNARACIVVDGVDGKLILNGAYIYPYAAEQTVLLKNSKYNSITNSLIRSYGSSDYALVLDSGAQYNNITGNTLVSYYNGAKVESSPNNNVSNNNFSGSFNANYGLIVYNSANTTIMNNRFTYDSSSVLQESISLSGCQNCFVFNNTDAGQGGMHVSSSDGITIANNTIGSFSYNILYGAYGFSLSSTSNCNITGNNVILTADIYMGNFYFQDVNYCNISRNVLNYRTIMGRTGTFFFRGSSHNDISYNSFLGDPGVGLRFNESSNYNYVHDHIIPGGYYTDAGIQIDSSHDNTVQRNNISGWNGAETTEPLPGTKGILIQNSNGTFTENTINRCSYGFYCVNALPLLVNNVISDTINPLDSCPPQSYQLLSTCGVINGNSTLNADLVNDSDSPCITFGADNITLDCAGHSILWNGSVSIRDFSEIYAEGRKNITVKNCILKGYPGSAGGYSHAIYLQSTSDSKAYNNIIYNFSHSTGYPNIRSGAILLQNSSRNLIYNNTLYNNTIVPIYLVYSSQNNSVQDNIMYNGTSGSVNIGYESDGNSILRNTIRNSNGGIGLLSLSSYNRVESNNISNNQRGISLILSDSNMILSNRISNITDPDELGALFVQDSSNTTITNNTISNSTFCGIGIHDSSNSTFMFNNTITKTFTGINVSSYPYYPYDVISNTTVYNTTYGIYLGRSTNVSVVNSTIYNTTYGIYFETPVKAYAVNNTVRNNVYGIYSSVATSSVVRNNNISSNTNTGVYIEDSDLNFSLNTVTLNGQYGVFCNTTVLKPTFSGNTISGNGNNCDDCTGCP